ncbi:hypothetical protein CEXT_100651, partial [Caerostris extrusa]
MDLYVPLYTTSLTDDGTDFQEEFK